MAKKDDELTKQDALEIVNDMFRILREVGIVPRLGAVPAKGDRPAGLMVFLPETAYVQGEGLRLMEDVKAAAAQ